MAAQVNGLCSGTGGGGGCGQGHREGRRGEASQTGRLAHRGNQVAGDRPAIADVGEHQPLLHGPGVVATDKANQAILAVSARHGVLGVHGLAFDEKGVEFGNDRAGRGFGVAELEAEVGGLGQARPAEVGKLANQTGRSWTRQVVPMYQMWGI